MTFIQVLRPFLRNLQLLSFISFEYDQKKGMIKTGKWYSLYTIVAFCVLQITYYHIAVMYTMYYENRNIGKESPVSEMVHIFEAWVIQIAISLVFFNGLWNQKTQVKFLNKLIEIEKQVLNIKMQLNQENIYKSMKRTSNCLKYCVGFFYFSMFIFKIYFYWNDLFLFVLAYYILCSLLLNSLFIVLVILVLFQKQLFQKLNDNMYRILRTKKINLSKTDLSDLKGLLETYNKLFATVKLFNDSFGLNVVAVIMYLIGIETCLLYIGPFIMLNIPKISFNFIWNGLVDIFWTAPLFAILTVLCFQCKKTQEEAEKIRKTIETEDFKELAAKYDLKENVSNIYLIYINV